MGFVAPCRRVLGGICHVFMDGGGLAMKFRWVEARCDDTPIIMVVYEIRIFLVVDGGDSEIILFAPLHNNKSPYLLEILRNKYFQVNYFNVHKITL